MMLSMMSNVANEFIWRQFTAKAFNFHVVWILMYTILTHRNMCRYTTHKVMVYVGWAFLFLLVVFLHADFVDSKKSDLFADEGLFTWTTSFLDLGSNVHVSEEVDWTTDHVLS